MKKRVVFVAGCLCLMIGGIGVFLPILPTTPFVLLAAGCFSYSAPNVYERLKKNKFFGPYIENYRTGKGVPFANKVQGVVGLWVLLSVSAIAMNALWSTILFSVIGTAVTIHIACLKTWREDAVTEEVLHADVG